MYLAVMVSSNRQRKSKHPVQRELDFRRDKNGQHRGGSRARAGRKPSGKRAGVSHRARPELMARHPQHVTMRVAIGVGWLRRMDAYRAIRIALQRVLANHCEFRVIHVSVQGTHIHALCEASTKETLARGVQGFQISAAKHINLAVSKRSGKRRTGRVFSDRYHVESISSVRQTRHALSYVINNWRRHGEDGGRVGLFGGRIDPFSSGALFEGWRPAIQSWPWPEDYEPPPVSQPQTWLLAQGWKRAKPIGSTEVPGSRTRSAPKRS